MESVLAAKESASNGPEEPPKYAVMDGECLAFPDNSFDSAICAGVLHHLDIRMAYAELARVLKPGGAVLCCEPLAYNPAIQLYRRLTPHLRTGWEAEHIISLREIRYAGELFERVTVRYYHLMTLLAVPFRRAPGFGKLLAILGWIDSWLLRIPGLQLMAWQVLFELSEPRKVSRP